MGRQRSGKLAFLDPPPAAALSEAQALLSELGAIDAAGRITEEGRELRALPLPPRLARMVVDAAAEGAGELAAAIAAVLTERGLGGDDLDLRHRLDQFRRDRSRRAEDARAMVKRWADTVGGKGAADEQSPGSLLALAYPDRIAKNRGGGGGGVPARQWPRRQCRSGVGAGARAVPGGGRIDRQRRRRAASCWRRRSRSPRSRRALPPRSKTAMPSSFDAGSASLRARRSRRLGAHRAGRADQAGRARRRHRTTAGARASRALGIGKLPWSKAQLQLRDRVPFLRQAEGDEWPDLSDDALAQSAAEWLAPFLAGKTALAQIGADDLAAALDALLPWNLRKRLDAEAPTHFTAPTGSRVPIDYEAEQGPTRVDPRAGIVRPRPPSERSPAAACRW